jgi:hypothetical protein
MVGHPSITFIHRRRGFTHELVLALLNAVDCRPIMVIIGRLRIFGLEVKGNSRGDTGRMCFLID